MPQFLGEIRLFSFSFPPKGWVICEGQLMAIIQNQALFSLLGTSFGGDGIHTFGLPDLQGRVPVGYSSTLPFGSEAGEPSHTLSESEIPAHNHLFPANTGTATTNTGNIPATAAVPRGGTLYSENAGGVVLDSSVVGIVGQSQAHENQQPYLTMNYCIAIQGVFPSRN